MSLCKAAAFRTYFSPNKRLPELLSKTSTFMSGHGHTNGHSSRYISQQVQSLPKLPLPSLQQSFELYLRYLKPLVPIEQWKQTKKEVDEFCEQPNEGPLLQSLLEKKAEHLDNWLVDWWLYTAYLDCRLPLPINVNPGIRFPERRFSSNQEWLWFSARLLRGAVDFYQLLGANKLPTDKLGGQPLCMAQYHSCLGTCRVPGFAQDSVLHTKNSTHVIVAFKGSFHRVEVIDERSKVALSTSDIFGQLQAIVSQPANSDQPAIGILTSLPRDQWAAAHRRLMANGSNRSILQQIQQSLLLLALDGSVLHSSGEDQQQALASGALNALHGGGSANNACNRWFDKTLQLIVSRDGTAGINYEHAPAEGPPIVRLVDHMFQRLKTQEAGVEPAPVGASMPKLLKWSIDSQTEDDIAAAKQHHNEKVHNLHCEAFCFTEFGKNVPKKHNVSPDAFIQVALQLAFKKLHNVSTATYESGSLRRFYLGRTDTIRSCSPESVAFCAAVLDNASVAHQLELLRHAVAAHRMYTDRIVSGQGFDRHLLGLRLIARDSKLAAPRWATSSSYQRSLHFRLSSSQVPAATPVTLLFGPVVEDGYGVCYNPHENEFHMAITDYRSCKDTDATKLAQELRASFRHLRHLLEAGEVERGLHSRL